MRQKDLHKLWKDLFTSLGRDDKGTELFTQSINQELFKQMLTTNFYSKHSLKQTVDQDIIITPDEQNDIQYACGYVWTSQTTLEA